MASGTVTVRIIGDASQFKKAIDDSESTLGRFSSRAQDVGSKMMSVGSKMTLGLSAPLALLGKSAVDAASDTNESLSKVRTVFGSTSISIEAFAKNAAKNMGLSRREALDMAGTFGNMFTQLGIGTNEAAAMSQQMGILASDLASFHNADITDVIDAQSAAFRGEYDSLQRFIPTLNAAAVEQKALELTGKATTAELTAQEKALATNTLMMEGAGAAAGDFARTSDGLANSQRIAAAEAKNASASLGEGLLPITQKVTEWAGKLGTAFGGLSSEWQTTILVVGAVLLAIGPLVTIIGGITAAVGALSRAMAFLAANPIVLVIAAVAALVAGLIYAYQHSETFRNIVDGVFRAVAGAAKFLADTVMTAFRWIRDHIDLVLLAMGPLGVAIVLLKNNWETVWKAISAAIKVAWDIIKPIIDKVKAGIDIVKDGLDFIARTAKSAGLGGNDRSIQNKFGGGRAHGGAVSAGTSYLVGERGPELFTPRATGSIIPNDAIRGSKASRVTIPLSTLRLGDLIDGEDILRKIAEHTRLNGPAVIDIA